MGKKKKGKSLLRSSSFSSNNEFCSFQDEVIQHLQLLKESNGLVIGFNANIRSIEKDSLCVIIYVSRKGTSALYHALNLMCKGKDVLFLQVQDINSNVFCSKVPSSTTYGIKKSIIDQPQFSKLLEKINNAKNARKNQKEKTDEKLSFKSEEFCVQSSCGETKSKDLSGIRKELCVEIQTSCKDIPNEAFSRKIEVIHPKHNRTRLKYTGQEGMLNFQEVDFPNYKTLFNPIAVTVK